jgi:hypothetical protein
MPRSAKIFLAIFIALLLLSTAASFYRYMILKDYEIVEDFFSSNTFGVLS